MQCVRGAGTCRGRGGSDGEGVWETPTVIVDDRHGPDWEGGLPTCEHEDFEITDSEYDDPEPYHD